MSASTAQAFQPGQVLALRVKEARERRGWSQGELAKRVSALGYSLARPVINRIEQGGVRAGNVSVEDLLALAAALGVPPVHLLVPLDDDAELAVTPGVPPLPAREARAWIRGFLPLPILPELDLRDLPESELVVLVEEELARRRNLTPITRALTRDDRREEAQQIVNKIHNADREEE
jgi:transcriptional regulator with XRE-family HTH domain